ncbi:unnamed protein product [Rotaria sp. Silwood1]|nr:unnamed protein product [Rotaria sp. Silwood1]CAF1533188.1 unnamed protein product [Rotaria sp. Silwood1]
MKYPDTAIGRSNLFSLPPARVKEQTPHESCLCICHENVDLLLRAYNFIGAAVLAYKPESLEHLFAGSATVLVNDSVTVPILRRVIV